MKIVIFGLAVSSAWGNGHATLWRGLGRALSRRGHDVVFFERDQPYYAQHRDMADVPGIDLVLYRDWAQVRARARAHLGDAEVGMVTSYCPDGRAASELVLSSDLEVRCFYDLDAPVTLAALDRREEVAYLPAGGLGGFDVVLSYTGGRALRGLRDRLGARRTAALYGSVDPDVHQPAPAQDRFAADLSYLGTYSPDRQATVDELLLAPAQVRPDARFLVGGAQYPTTAAFGPNVRIIEHVAPRDHAAFYASSPLTLNTTRAPMAALGYCPSARFFEAAACGVPVLTDGWEGLDQFFAPGREVLVARTRQDTLEALAMPRAELSAIGRRARERALAEHTAARRALDLERILDDVSAHHRRAEAV